MKKLKLNLVNLEGTQVLTRDQLKRIMGGQGSGEGSGTIDHCGGAANVSICGTCWTTDNKCLCDYCCKNGPDAGVPIVCGVACDASICGH
ncbi:hypothetical protein SAMN04487894_12617 [Niabella drilacis]|uniref:Uncharacterized protein n=1 Tax=Niabella drilacis (strain DSM 25811 / CCM 8410 / CCUG 62505 / LMG 26954 / E90) TaxID=1285928 RepID=A0A1G7B1W9_NIADE|nr:hypothetical protein SAMN04487894_12617 [Niabella drilacis]